jgi:peptide chain release factor 2
VETRTSRLRRGAGEGARVPINRKPKNPVGTDFPFGVICTLQINEVNMILLPESDEELLRECEVDTFRSSGPGGQHVNKTESAVRLKHLPSGVVVMSQQERSQHRNKALCLEKLRAKIEKLNYRPAKRVPTRVPRSVKNRTLEAKARRSRIKQLRSRPSADE